MHILISSKFAAVILSNIYCKKDIFSKVNNISWNPINFKYDQKAFKKEVFPTTFIIMRSKINLLAFILPRQIMVVERKSICPKCCFKHAVFTVFLTKIQK